MTGDLGFELDSATDERDPGLVAEFLRAGVGCLI